MPVTMQKPKASDLFTRHDLGLEQEIPHCVAAANGSWCDLDVGGEDADDEFDEEDFDDDFDDDFEEEEDDGYGDFDDSIDPFATEGAEEKEEDAEVDK